MVQVFDTVRRPAAAVAPPPDLRRHIPAPPAPPRLPVPTVDRLRRDARRLLEQARAELGESDRFLLATVRLALAEVTVELGRQEKLLAEQELRALGARPEPPPEDEIQSNLTRALAAERITPHGLALLRDRYGLTPAETNVFVEYYLTSRDAAPTGAVSKRRAVAHDLNLSENTLMHHITSIRRKLGLAARNGSAALLMWCLSTGITTLHSPPLHPGPTEDLAPGQDQTPSAQHGLRIP